MSGGAYLDEQLRAALTDAVKTVVLEKPADAKAMMAGLLLQSAGTSLSGCTLTYFPLSGRGEATRIALHFAGIDFIDSRIYAEWGDFKPTTPWGSMPTLTLKDGTVLGQGRAILRLAGKRAGLYPSDDVEACKVDNLLDALDDIFATISKVPKEERVENVKTGTIGSLFGKIEAFLALHGKGCAVGNSLTIADISVFAVFGAALGTIFDNMTYEMLDAYPTILAIRKAVASHPKVVEWFEKQKKQEYWSTMMGGGLPDKYKLFFAENL